MYVCIYVCIYYPTIFLNKLVSWRSARWATMKRSQQRLATLLGIKWSMAGFLWWPRNVSGVMTTQRGRTKSRSCRDVA